MTSWATLDVAIGLVAVYFVLSLLASTLNESIATMLGWRARFLERWLRNLFTEGDGNEETAAADAFIAQYWRKRGPSCHRC